LNITYPLTETEAELATIEVTCAVLCGKVSTLMVAGRDGFPPDRVRILFECPLPLLVTVTYVITTFGFVFGVTVGSVSYKPESLIVIVRLVPLLLYTSILAFADRIGVPPEKFKNPFE